MDTSCGCGFDVKATPRSWSPCRPMITTGRSLPCVGSSSYGTHVQTTSPGSASPSRCGEYSMWRSLVATSALGGGPGGGAAFLRNSPRTPPISPDRIAASLPTSPDEPPHGRLRRRRRPLGGAAACCSCWPCCDRMHLSLEWRGYHQQRFFPERGRRRSARLRSHNACRRGAPAWSEGL